jgi:hypothetical protein
MSEGYVEFYIAEDGTKMAAMYTYNYEAGEADYVGSIPAHWGPTPEDWEGDDDYWEDE